METTQDRLIPIEVLKELLASRGMVVRQAQRIDFETAWRALNEIGSFLVRGFTIDKDNEFVYANALKWCINDPPLLRAGDGKKVPADPQKGIYIYGNVGTGKSLALDILRTFCRAYGLKAKFGEEIASLAWRTYRADDICDTYSQEGDLHRWKEEKCLCIQDLGTEPAELLYMGNRRRVLRSILEARGDMFDRLTLISSNIPLDATADIYGPRVRSRLVQMCNPFRMDGPDRRK